MLRLVLGSLLLLTVPSDAGSGGFEGVQLGIILLLLGLVYLLWWRRLLLVLALTALLAGLDLPNDSVLWGIVLPILAIVGIAVIMVGAVSEFLAQAGVPEVLRWGATRQGILVLDETDDDEEYHDGVDEQLLSQSKEQSGSDNAEAAR